MSDLATLAPFGDTPDECPKCGTSWSETPPMIEFHTAANWSCYQQNVRLAEDHLHYECFRCRWSYAAKPRDAA